MLFNSIKLDKVNYFYLERNKKTVWGNKDVLYVKAGDILIKLLAYPPKYTDQNLSKETFFENLFAQIRDNLKIETKIIVG